MYKIILYIFYFFTLYIMSGNNDNNDKSIINVKVSSSLVVPWRVTTSKDYQKDWQMKSMLIVATEEKEIQFFSKMWGTYQNFQFDDPVNVIISKR